MVITACDYHFLFISNSYLSLCVWKCGVTTYLKNKRATKISATPII